MVVLIILMILLTLIQTWNIVSTCGRKNLGADSVSSIRTLIAASSSAFSIDCTTTCKEIELSKNI